MILHTKGGEAFQISRGDWFAVSRYSWRGGQAYVRTNIGKRGSPGYRTVPLHLFLLGSAPDGLEWDHRNRDTRDNRRSNLRHATQTVQARNASVRRDNRSGARGVVRRGKRWLAFIHVGGRQINVGRFPTFVLAVAARLSAERRLW